MGVQGFQRRPDLQHKGPGHLRTRTKVAGPLSVLANHIRQCLALVTDDGGSADLTLRMRGQQQSRI